MARIEVNAKLRIMVTAFTFVSIACFATFSANGAEKFPSGAVKVIITHPAGTSNDIEFRSLQPTLQKILGTPVVVENMAGTGGRKSREFVFKAPPDGYTLLSTGMPSCQLGEILFNGRYKTLEFSHIYSLFSDATALLVRTDSPHKDVADFVAKHKGKLLACAFPGVGSTAHLNGMSFTRSLGLNAKWVPYDGGTESLTALAGGHVDYVVCDVGSAKAMLSAKAAKLLMVFDEKRDPRYPEIPTPKELGYKMNIIASLRGIVGPPGIPKDVAKTLESAFAKAGQEKEFLSIAEKGNVRVTPRDSKGFFAESQSIYNELKEQETTLKALMKSN